MANEEGVCAFCHRDDVSADLVGDTLHADGLTVHHHCLVSALYIYIRTSQYM